MNERIKELIEQSTSIVESPKNAYGWGSSYAEFDKVKFALLIVQECVSIVAKRKDQAINDGCNVDEAMSMAEMDLLEQFGVEDPVQDSNLHTCPYAEEIHGDYETLCDCDEEATRQCAMDV